MVSNSGAQPCRRCATPLGPRVRLGFLRHGLRTLQPAAVHAVLCAAGFNIRWLLRAIAAKGLRALLLALSQWALWLQWIASALHIASTGRALPTGSLESRTHHAQAIS